MKGKVVKKNLTSKDESPSPWHEAIEQVHKRLEQHKIQGQKLRNALRTFEENLATSAPWPGITEQQKSPQEVG